MSKIIVLGMNRTGTKLASFLASKHFNLKNVYLEPFTWDKGINASVSDNWQPQQKLRNRSYEGESEHKALNIISIKGDQSDWLHKKLTEENWDILKFIEIGRAGLINRYAPDASYILLTRHPLSFMKSICGMPSAKEAVIEQSRRLIQLEGIIDPLPDAEQYLNKDLADCARAYHILYKNLSTFNPKKGIRISYEELINTPNSLKLLATEELPFQTYDHKAPLLGSSTKSSLSENTKHYITENLYCIYDNFLKKK